MNQNCPKKREDEENLINEEEESPETPELRGVTAEIKTTTDNVSERSLDVLDENSIEAYIAFLKGKYNQGFTNPDEEKFAPAIEAKLRAKAKEIERLKKEVSDLPQIYREKVEKTLNDHLEKIKKTLEEYLETFRNQLRLQSLLSQTNYSLTSLRDIYRRSQEVKRMAKRLPQNVMHYFEQEIEEEEKELIEKTSLKGNESQKEENYFEFQERRIKILLENPGLFEFMTERIGHLGKIFFIKKFKQYREDYLKLKPLIEASLLIRPMLNKYKKFNQKEDFYKDAEQFLEVDENLKKAKKEDIEAMLRDAHLCAERLKAELNMQKYCELVEKFDKEIAPNVRKSQTEEIIRLYAEMVLSYGKIEYEEFKNRVQKAMRLIDEFDDFEIFKTENKGEFTANIKKSMENFCVEAVIQNGLDPEALKQEIVEEYEKVKRTYRITINVNRKSLEKIYRDGFIKTYEEIEHKRRDGKGISGKVHTYEANRRKRDNSLRQEGRFIVGALASDNGYDEAIGPAPFYGHGFIELKPENIADRVQFFEGDSLTSVTTIQKIIPRWLARKWEEPETRKVDFNGAMFSKALMEVYLRHAGLTHIHTMYVEAHVFGNITVDDFKSVKYGILQEDPQKEQELTEMADRLERERPSVPRLQLVHLNKDLKTREDPFDPYMEKTLKEDQLY